ncbi:MAG: hypothetical protein IPJ88_14785 [Myxococcales bacterium]|nr:MAG: hypothetical protein IPJ88_14785 [Myxococcales bacterium]
MKRHRTPKHQSNCSNKLFASVAVTIAFAVGLFLSSAVHHQRFDAGYHHSLSDSSNQASLSQRNNYRYAYATISSSSEEAGSEEENNETQKTRRADDILVQPTAEFVLFFERALSGSEDYQPSERHAPRAPPCA